ncbi:MAG: division/cell wall cluster transcriptional repressor MraZ [Chloroflexota bacterium]
MFVGTSNYRVDEKGRIPIPPSFRREFTEGGYLTPGPEGCIWLYTISEFDEIAHGLKAEGLPKADQRRLTRALFSDATDVKPDAQGRIALSTELREYAGITDSVAVIGANTYVEVWDPERWHTWKSQQQQAWQVIETLEQKGPKTC